MRLVLNWLLLCLLALALPLQGLAAVGQRACQPGTASQAHSVSAAIEAEQAMQAVHDAAHERHGAHRSQGAASDDALHAAHDHAHAHPSMDDDAHADHHGATASPEGEHHKCSSCASCCVGAALPVTVTVFSTHADAMALVPTQPASAPGWLPPQPKRPPRPVAL